MIEDFRHDKLTTFHGLPVYEFDLGLEEDDDPDEAKDAALAGVPTDVEGWAWRIVAPDYDDPDGVAIMGPFLETVDTTRVKALILGAWNAEMAMEHAAQAADELLASADRFPALEALFLNDISWEESEVSWIEPADPAPLLAAFPNLVVFGMRGGTGLSLGPVEHANLRELTFQAGGLPPAVVRALAQWRLPNLTGLDLYLGTEAYEGGATADDLETLLAGTVFPALRHLGLRNAANADDIAEALAHAPVVAQLESLDLSLGTLGDVGAAALLAGQPLTHLKTLNLRHHFMSQDMAARVVAALPGVAVDVSENLEPEKPWRDGDPPRRYIAVAE